jgi:hypothetical protein
VNFSKRLELLGCVHGAKSGKKEGKEGDAIEVNSKCMGEIQ